MDALLTINSTLNGAILTIEYAPHLDQTTKQELAVMLLELDDLLQSTSPHAIDDAEALVEFVKDLMTAIAKEQPSWRRVELTSDVVAKAALNLAYDLPPVVALINRITQKVRQILIS